MSPHHDFRSTPPVHWAIEDNRMACGLLYADMSRTPPCYPRFTLDPAKATCRNCRRSIDMARPKLVAINGERV